MKNMATPSSDTDERKNDSSLCECNICFEQAKDAVVSMCGHLFCWPCIHRWIETRSTAATCPVCKSAIDKERLIPLYGRGSGEQKDPRDTVPPRPQGQREEPSAQPAEGYGMNGIHVSFGIGAFPFTMFGMPFLQVLGGGPPQPYQQAGVPLRHEQQQQQLMTRLFIVIAVLVFLSVILS